MPQHRRKVAFSGKKKKEQLFQKRESKRSTHDHFLLNKSLRDSSESEDEKEGPSSAMPEVRKLNVQPSRDGLTNRYAFHFYKESEKQLKEARLDARRGVSFHPETDLEIDDKYFTGFDFPRRPDWTYEMSKAQVDFNENKYFRDYMQQIEKSHFEENKILSYCELNLETWRQLWRVLELSDVVLVIVDIRYASLMFPPSLYQFIVDCGKDMILVLNKIDLVTCETVVAWMDYFQTKYPSLHILAFTSYPGSKSINLKVLQRRRRFGKLRMAAHGALKVYEKCKVIVGDEVNLSSWKEKIESELVQPTEEEESDFEANISQVHEEEKFFDFQKPEKYRNGILTIGCVGFPNAGKSSLMNALIGRKVVSVSRTPGHTKHFQTIFLTDTVRLCDCPGLVFPSSVPRSIQVLIGSYPIAQLREPYASLRYLAERTNIIGILNIQQEDKNEEWSPISICEAWALKRGFLTAKAARPDVNRASNDILRMALDGKVVLSLKPIGYFENLDGWKTHPSIEDVKVILNRQVDDGDLPVVEENSSESEDDELYNNDNSPNDDSIKIEIKNPFDLLQENGE